MSVSLKFHDRWTDKTVEIKAEVITTEIKFFLTEKNSEHRFCMDKQTAIKFSKELRKQIALLK